MLYKAFKESFERNFHREILHFAGFVSFKDHLYFFFGYAYVSVHHIILCARGLIVKPVVGGISIAETENMTEFMCGHSFKMPLCAVSSDIKMNIAGILQGPVEHE